MSSIKLTRVITRDFVAYHKDKFDFSYEGLMAEYRLVRPDGRTYTPSYRIAYWMDDCLISVVSAWQYTVDDIKSQVAPADKTLSNAVFFEKYKDIELVSDTKQFFTKTVKRLNDTRNIVVHRNTLGEEYDLGLENPNHIETLSYGGVEWVNSGADNYIQKLSDEIFQKIDSIRNKLAEAEKGKQ